MPGQVRLMCFGLLIAGLLAACSVTEQRVITITATPVPFTPGPPPADAIGPDRFPPGVNPLTGLTVADPGALRRRPLAVKISNAPDSVRPQAGIGRADLVFEHYVEGRLTRFTAIFWTTTPPRVGSVRSARLIDLDVPVMYGALFAYSGASEPIRQQIAASSFAPRAYEGVTVGAPLYYRDPQIDAPHNLFVIPAQVWARAAADGVNDSPDDLGGMVFSATPPKGGFAARRITLTYGPDVVRWDYDARTGRYARFDDGEPHRDADTGEQVTAANVVLIYARHQEDLSIVESEWQGRKDYSIHIQLSPLGPATLFRDGRLVQGVWQRQEADELLTLWADPDATRLYLKPGNTWFQVVPLDFTGVRIE